MKRINNIVKEIMCYMYVYEHINFLRSSYESDEYITEIILLDISLCIIILNWAILMFELYLQLDRVMQTKVLG